MFRALSRRVAVRWQFVSFRGRNKGEWRGVVDLIAIRKNTTLPIGKTLKRGDLFDLILVQIKGGSAKAPTLDDKLRLVKVSEYYRASEIVQFCWKKGKSSAFSVLQPNLTWRDCSGHDIFG